MNDAGFIQPAPAPDDPYLGQYNAEIAVLAESPAPHVETSDAMWILAIPFLILAALWLWSLEE